MPTRIDLPVGGLVLAVLLAGCEQANTYVAPPPPKVTVAKPLVQEVIDYLEFTGTTVASEQVEVRARVAGVLQSMRFQPGTEVKEDALLFVIDPKEYEADLQAAQAELASAQAKLERAQKEFSRSQRLFKQQAGSDVEVVKWRGEEALARAAIERANADIARAQLNLGYTRVKASISGRVGRNRVDVGNLVGQGEATVLTEVTDFDPMYVYFNLNELDLLRVRAMYRAEVKKKGLDPAKDPDREANIKVYLGLADEEGYPHEGVLDFAESGVDPDTGTIQLRAVFNNEEVPYALIPGLFARVRLPIAKRPDMPMVTDRAINADQSGRYLLVVNSENVVEKHNVRLGRLVDGLRVIEEGLRSEDWVVVNGIQRARPGGKVGPEKIDMASLTSSALRTAAKAEKTQSPASGADTPEPKQKQ